MALTNVVEQGLGDIGHRSMFDNGGGYRSIAEVGSPQFKRGVLETARGMARVKKGQGTMREVIEAQGTDEFQWYMSHILQRRTYDKYDKMRGEWRSYVRESTVPDFRPVERLWRHDNSALMPFLQEQEQYSYTGVSGDKTTYQIAKYGRLMGLTWEDIINDDLMFLEDFPMTLAQSAVQTEDNFVTRLYASATGPVSSVFSTGNGNLLKANSDLGTSINAPLSIDAIIAAKHQLETQTIGEDDNDYPIRFSSFVVVVPHRQQLIVDWLMNSREIRSTSSADAKGGNEYEFIMNSNAFIGNITFQVNPTLDIVTPSSHANANAWYMFGIPTNSRPGIEVAYLRGHTRPQIFMRMSDSRALGGGDIRGSFEKDTLDYKARGVFGGTVIDHRQMLASDGSGD